MHLAQLKLWNFRKYGTAAAFDLSKPDLVIPFNPGVSALVGPNDSGKTAVIDAIRLVLGTNSLEWTRVTPEDFHPGTDRMRVELRFDGFAIPEEAKNFTEWLDWEQTATGSKPVLTVFYDAALRSGSVLPSDIKAGGGSEGHSLNAATRELLRVTYLKPLRDAKTELIPRRNSRLSQILQGHEAFKGHEKDHHLVDLFKQFNKSVSEYFEGKDANGNVLVSDQQGKVLKDEIDKYLKSFTEPDVAIKLGVSDNDEDVRRILETLGLTIADLPNPGLGSLNRMFMAAELVHLDKKDWTGVRLALVEELEAHLHPQAQMKVVDGLLGKEGRQIILTTHSPNLASKLPLDSLIMLNGGGAYPLGKDSSGKSYTQLDAEAHQFLQWFLDVSKANLFFANGVILVEGWSEEILLPALALKMKKQGLIDRDLTEAGVSIVNVGGTSQLRYAKIFERAAAPHLQIPVAVVTDVDVPVGRMIASTTQPRRDAKRIKKEFAYAASATVTSATLWKSSRLKTKFDRDPVRSFISPEWTLEYCLWKSPYLKAWFETVAGQIHSSLTPATFDRRFPAMLCNGTLDKTSLADALAEKIAEDAKSTSNVLTADDSGIAYLMNAIKYASGSTN